jgi:predicted CopG family antitoxin
MSRSTILVRDETRERLKEMGKKGQSYDELINQLLEFKKIQLMGGSKASN